MIERRYVTGVYNPIGSYFGRCPAGEPTELIEYEWVFTHIDLYPWDDECDGEFHSRRLFCNENHIDIYQCDKCGEMWTLEELQIAAAESMDDWKSKCKREVVR